jgi:RNA polymerase sigma factor (sigma-70 family)
MAKSPSKEIKPASDDTAGKSDDRQLSESLLSGDEFACTLMYNKYVDSLYAYGMGMGFEEETVKDAIQDVFYKLYFNRKLLKGVENLKYYLFRMLKNRLLDIYKSEIEACRLEEYDLSFSVQATVLDELIGEEEKLVLQKKIERLLNSLTDRQREAVYLRFIQEMDYEEIARLLKMTPHATRKLISRAMQRLREQNFLLFSLLICVRDITGNC